MASAASVTSIGSRSAWQPDFRGLAAGHLRAARKKLGLDHAGFAAYLDRQLDWDVMPGTVARWEDGAAVPPGDVLLAAEAVTGGDPDGAGKVAGHLLAAVPHSFAAEALAGLWVTCYHFGHGADLHCHADIAQVTAESGRHIRAANHPPEPRSEGRASPFRNVIEAQLAGRHLVGQWRNTSDTRYFGSLQLAVLPGETVMEGYYAGVGSDIQVSTGYWKWVRLEPADTDLAAVGLRDPAVLYGLVMSRSQYDAPLTLSDVREDA